MDWLPVRGETWRAKNGRLFDVLYVGNSRVFIRWHEHEIEDTLPLNFFDSELSILELL